MRKRQSGMTLVEVLAGMAILSVMVLATLTVMTNAHQLTRNTTHKEFATQKAISVLEELKSLVQSANGNSINVLDSYDDGTNNSTLLTTQGQALNNKVATTKPDDQISGNEMIDPATKTWRYVRHVTVTKLPGQANDVRLVDVKVYENTDHGQILLSEVSSVIRTIVSNMPPTQVYDVYCLALENVPGWWVYMSNVVPFVRNSINDLQARNPGLVFRTHWITALAYGRDQEYKPYVNQKADSTADVPGVYFYPGAMPTSGTFSGCCGDDYYYPPFFFRARVNIDGTETNGYDQAKNPAPYALADQYNNAMRYPDELALYQTRLKAAQSNNTTEEMSWHLLLEDMSSNPTKYTNALFINLHGELMPFPPIRNYSDAAKNPSQTVAPDLRGVRAVTHPEQLRYINTDNVRLRVYTYLENPAVGPDIMPDIVTIKISGLNSWTPATGSITNIHGGVDNDGDGKPDPYDAGPVTAPACPVVQPSQMCWSSTLSGNDTVIKLYNSPLRATLESGTAGAKTSGRGLAVEDRLYGLEYIPSPVENLTTGGVQFSTDLSAPQIGPKNTARWIITIPAASISNDQQITIETRIGDQLTSGVMYPTADHPSNLSRTYTWRGQDSYIFGTVGKTPPALPITERYQFIGDPRHLPYADLKRPHISNTFPSSPIGSVGKYESVLGMGYNRYFNDFEDGTFNRGQSAEQTGLGLEKWVISANTGNNVARFSINGAAAFSVTIADGTYDANGIAAALNANLTFNVVARAVGVSGHVRVTSKKLAGSSVQYDMTNATAAVLGSQLGFDGTASSSAGWPGWVYTVSGTSYGVKNNGTIGDSGWETNGGRIEVDVHRLFQVLRSALVNSSAIYSTMTGFSYYYIGIGGEIGYDSANNFPNSVPISTMVTTGASGGVYENSITGTVKLIRENTNNGWWSKPWIGELYPDSQYVTAWNTLGNIPSGSGASHYIRDVRSKFPPFSGTILTDAVRRTKERGCTTFFWAGKAGATFHHGYYDPDSAAIQTPGQDIADHYSMPVPGTIANARPFDIALNYASAEPESFLAGGYPPAYNIAAPQTYYLHSGSGPTLGSALITLTDSKSNYPAFIAVNGLSPTGVSGTTFIAKYSFLTLVQSFFNGGLYTDSVSNPTNAMHVRQVPHVAITAPNDQTNLKKPSAITVSWDSTWVRWDGLNYTIDPKFTNWVENLTLKFAVLYSPSNGIPNKSAGNLTGWFYMQDNTSATLGQKPDSAHEIAQAISTTKTSNSYTWSVPAATFPEGNYVIRVEAYREGYPLHYAFHQYRAFIQRN